MNKTLAKMIKTFFRDITSLVGNTSFILLLVFVYLFDKEIFIPLCFGFIFSILIVSLIRLIYFKDRPKKRKYTNLIERIDASSFPSLHTARAWFLAVFFISYFQEGVVSLILVIMALIISYSRIYLLKHDWWDLLGGLWLGLVTFGATFLF